MLFEREKKQKSRQFELRRLIGLTTTTAILILIIIIIIIITYQCMSRMNHINEGCNWERVMSAVLSSSDPLAFSLVCVLCHVSVFYHRTN